MWSRSGSTGSTRSTNCSASPSRAAPSSAATAAWTARNTSQVSADATTTADSRPSFASASCGPSNANVAISNETVKPMPAIVPLPTTAGPADLRPEPPAGEPGRAARTPPITATGLPTTYPTRMPSVIGEVYAWPRKSRSIGMPALARPNNGTIR